MRIQKAYNSLISLIHTISDVSVKKTVLCLLQDPIPTFFSPATQHGKLDRLTREMFERGMVTEKQKILEIFHRAARFSSHPQLFLTAPGAQMASHDAYPGGLVLHTLFNLEVALSLARGYGKVYQTRIKRSYLIGAIALHDLMKSWILQWTKKQDILGEVEIAQTWSHHIFILAEALYRQLPPLMIQCMACVHLDPTVNQEGITRYIKAASLMSGVDPFESEVLTTTHEGDIGLVGGLKLEHWIARASESSTRGLAVAQAKAVWEAFQVFAQEKLGLAPPNLGSGSLLALKNYILSQETELHMYEKLTREGIESFNNRITTLIKDIS